MIALIPARSSSKRIPNKNIRKLGAWPLVQWTIKAAHESMCFSGIYVSTDSEEIARNCPAVEIIMRPPHIAQDDSPDRDWIVHAIETIDYRTPVSSDIYSGDWQTLENEFCLLRPTSPFRDAQTIQRAVAAWRDYGAKYDSLRAVRRVTEHPLKTWQRDTEDLEEGVFGIAPFVFASYQKHLHSLPTQSLQDAWIQTAGLEIFRRDTVMKLTESGPYDGPARHTIAGRRVLGFELEGSAALDINTWEDWRRAEDIAADIEAEALAYQEVKAHRQEAKSEGS